MNKLRGGGDRAKKKNALRSEPMADLGRYLSPEGGCSHLSPSLPSASEASRNIYIYIYIYILRYFRRRGACSQADRCLEVFFLRAYKSFQALFSFVARREKWRKKGIFDFRGEVHVLCV